MVDPISVMNKINRFGKYLLIFVLFINFIGVVVAAPAPATGGSSNIASAMKDLCNTARSLLAVGAMLLIILAAAVYAIGQIVGAETRARAAVWATAMITGAVIGIVIYLIVPSLIGLLLGTGATVSSTDPCAITFTG